MVKEFNFKVTVDEANLILQGLAELPAKASMNIIAKLQQQAQSAEAVAEAMDADADADEMIEEASQNK